MKIKKSYIQNLVKEELSKVLFEMSMPDVQMPGYTLDLIEDNSGRYELTVIVDVSNTKDPEDIGEDVFEAEDLLHKSMMKDTNRFQGISRLLASIDSDHPRHDEIVSHFQEEGMAEKVYSDGGDTIIVLER